MDSESIEKQVQSELAPTGRLRVGINFGNTVLARRNETGAAAGIAADLAQELAGRLSVPLEFVTFATAGTMASAVSQNAWDVAFLAADPERGQQIAFTEPYLEIDTTCIVPAGSRLVHVSELDREGVRIVVSAGSAYDLFLTRTLQHAELVRAPSPSASADLFFTAGYEALAGIGPMLADILSTREGFRLLEGRLTTVQQAIGSPRGRPAAAAYLQEFVADIKRSGLVAAIVEKNGVSGVSIPLR